MEWYYATVFLVIAIFQEQVEGFTLTFCCSILTLVNEYCRNYFIDLGFSFFFVPLVIDTLLILIGLSFIGNKLSNILLSVAVVSITVNIFFWVHYNPEGAYLYQIIQPYYKYINIILLEILVYSCLAHSRLVPLGKEYFMKARSWYVARNN